MTKVKLNNIYKNPTICWIEVNNKSIEVHISYDENFLFTISFQVDGKEYTKQLETNSSISKFLLGDFDFEEIDLDTINKQRLALITNKIISDNKDSIDLVKAREKLRIIAINRKLEVELNKYKNEEELRLLEKERITEQIENEKSVFWDIKIGSRLEAKLVAKSLPDKLIFVLENGMIGTLHIFELDWNYRTANSDYLNANVGDKLTVEVLGYDDEIHEFTLGRKFSKQLPKETNEWKDLILMKETDAIVIGEYKDAFIIALEGNLFGTLPFETEKINKPGTIVKVIPAIKNDISNLIECVTYDFEDKLFYLTQGKFRDNERLGDLHFEKAISCLLKEDFNQAYEELMSGFYKATCDCILPNLIKSNRYEINCLFDEDKPVNCSSNKLDFLRAIICFFNDEFDEALIFINLFIKDPYNEIGDCFKGRILAGLGKFDEAVEELESSNFQFERTARLNYRLGRIKEEHTDQSGLADLWESVTDNLSSLCAQRWLKDSAEKRGIKLKTNTNALLVNKFNTSETEDYLDTINRFLKRGYVELTDKSILSTSVAFSELIQSLLADRGLFGVKSVDEDQSNEVYYNERWSCDICGGNSDTGCWYFDPTECPRSK
jgi:hypothetical protein